MQNGQPDPSLERILLQSGSGAQTPATLFQRILGQNTGTSTVQEPQLQNVQAQQPRPQLNGNVPQNVQFRAFTSQASTSQVNAQNSQSRMINSTGNINRPQTSTFLSPHVSQPSSRQTPSPWRANPPTTTPGPNIPTAAIRFPSIPPGMSPVIATTTAPTSEAIVNLPQQTVNTQVNHPTVTTPSAPPSEKACSPPKPITPPLPQTLSPTIVAKLQHLSQTLGESNIILLAMIKNSSPEFLKAEFGELEQLEEDTELELLPQEIAVRAEYSKEFNECNEDFEKAIKDEEETKKLLTNILTQKQNHKKKMESLNKEEYEIPQTSQLPAEILVEQIVFENKSKLETFDLKRLFFRAEYAEDDDEDFVEMDFDDEIMMVQDENLLGVVKRPDYYVAEDICDFENQREKYWPLIKSLAYEMEEFNLNCQETIETNHDRFFSYAQPWKLKQERADRNTKKIHRDNLKRELYERTFPDIKRAREEKERAARSEKRPNAKQEAAMAKAKGDRRKKVFGSAVIPPMKRTPLMNDKPKGRVMDDPMYEAQDSIFKFLHSWTEHEKAMYQKHFLRFGKNFSAIAACLGTKNTTECIRYFFLTKQHVKYKQLHRMKRKKAGKAYKPNPYPTEGERTSEKIKHFPYMRTNKYTECLICDRHMPCYLVPKIVKGIPVPGEFIETIQSKLPICDPCNNHVRKAKAANYSKCPLVGCSLGRRRTKPNRTIPETANKLDIEKRQYIIHRRKLHPDAVKCCGSCIRKIQNDFADLAAGKLDEQIKEFAQTRLEKKRQKECEHIPVWKEWELWKLRDAVLTFGISNWFEVASRMGIRNKTPYWCYMKYKEMYRNGKWDSMDKDLRPIEPYESEAPMQNEAVDYLSDIIESVQLKEKGNKTYGLQIKEEIITPINSPQMVAEQEQNGFIENDYDDNKNFEVLMQENFTKRERRIIRHEFLQEISEFKVNNPVSMVEMIKLEQPEESMEIVENHTNERLPPITNDDDDEIQIISVIPPPQQRQFFSGSLTQGTPRAASLAPDHLPLLSMNLLNNVNNNGITPFMSSEERFKAFNNDTLRTLLQRPSTNFNNAVDPLKDDLSLLFSNVVNSVPPMPSSRGPSSVTSVTPVDTPITTNVDVVNFFLPEPQSVQPKIIFSNSTSPLKEKSKMDTVAIDETTLKEESNQVEVPSEKENNEEIEKVKNPELELDKNAISVINDETKKLGTFKITPKDDEVEEERPDIPVVIDVPTPTGNTPPPEVDLTTLPLSELINRIVNASRPLSEALEMARRQNAFEREQALKEQMLKDGGGNIEQNTSVTDAQNPNQRIHTPPLPQAINQAFLEAKKRLLDKNDSQVANIPCDHNSNESNSPKTVDPVKRKSGVLNTMLPYTHTTYKNAMHIRIPHSAVPSEASSENASPKDDNKEKRATSQDAMERLLKLMSPFDEEQIRKKPSDESEITPKESIEEGLMKVDKTEEASESPLEIQKQVLMPVEVQKDEIMETEKSDVFQGEWPIYERGTTPYSDSIVVRTVSNFYERPLSTGDAPQNYDDVIYANFETEENDKPLEEQLDIGDSALSPTQLSEDENKTNKLGLFTTEKLKNIAHFRNEVPLVPDIDNQTATFPSETPADYMQIEERSENPPMSKTSEVEHEEPRPLYYDPEAWRQQTAYAEALQAAREQALLEDAEEEREYMERRAQELVLEEAPMTVAEKIASMITSSNNINPDEIENPDLDTPINDELNLNEIDEDEIEMDLQIQYENSYIRNENLDYNEIDPAFFAQFVPLKPLELDCLPNYQYPPQDYDEETFQRIRQHANRFLGAPIVNSLRTNLLVPRRRRRRTRTRKRRHRDFNDPWDPTRPAHKRARVQNDVLEPHVGPSRPAPDERLQNIPEEDENEDHRIGQIAAVLSSNQNVVQEENNDDRIFRFDAGYLNRTFGIEPQNEQVLQGQLQIAQENLIQRPFDGIDVFEDDFFNGNDEDEVRREPILLGNRPWDGHPLRFRSPFLRHLIIKRKNGLMKNMIPPVQLIRSDPT